MTESSKSELILIEATPTQAVEKNRARNSAPNPEKAAKAAIKRCCDAYNRAYKATMEKCRLNPGEDGLPPDQAEMIDSAYASHIGSIAYRDAMPFLTGIDGIRDFVACVAYGIVNETIQPKKFKPLLYAAQVALSVFNSTPRPEKQ